MFGTQDKTEQFEAAVMQHMDAAYNLALWLSRNEHDAQDIAQDAALRAFRFLDQFDGRDSRAWFLTIVRNTFYSWIRKNRPEELSEALEDEAYAIASEAPSPELELLRNLDRKKLWDAMGKLSLEIRETLVLREFEELSYREIASLISVPIGTVMSRLSRGRKQLQVILSETARKGVTP